MRDTFLIKMLTNALSKLIRCSDKCLSCSNNKDNCISCPITRYSFIETIKSDNADPNNNTNKLAVIDIVYGPQLSNINVIKHCLKKCPTEKDGKSIVINESSKECLIKEGSDVILAIVPTIFNMQNLFDSVMRLKVQYDKSVLKTRKLVLKGGKSSYHDACNKRGDRKEIENGIYGSIVFCKCHKDFTGTNCQIPVSIVETYQQALAKLMDQLNINIFQKDQSSRKKLLDSLILLNKFELNLSLIRKMYEFIKSVVHHDKHLENRKKLYNILDYMLLNLMNLVHRGKHQANEGVIIESDISTQLNQIYDEIGKVLISLEDAFEDLKYSQSFLEFDMKHYLTIDTTSYIMAEYRYSDYLSERGFLIANPVMDDLMTHKFTTNTLYLEFNKGNRSNSIDERNNKYYLQALNISTPLFENKLDGVGLKPFSNVMYFRNIDPEESHVDVSNDKADIRSLTIKFALHSIPIEDKPEEAIECIGYGFDSGKSIKGVVESFIDSYDEEKSDGNDENAYVICMFEGVKNFKGYYFMAVLKLDKDV